MILISLSSYDDTFFFFLRFFALLLAKLIYRLFIFWFLVSVLQNYAPIIVPYSFRFGKPFF
jgi:hypothetical protein